MKSKDMKVKTGVEFEVSKSEVGLFEEVLDSLDELTRNGLTIQRDTKIRFDFFEVLNNVLMGGFGRFQLLVLILFLTLEIPVAFATFIPIFVGGKIIPSEWKCGGEEILSSEDMCNCNTTLTTDSLNSITTEWSLVCEKRWVADFITGVQMLAMFVGNSYGSQFADWYGRKAGFLWTVLLLILGSAVSAAAPNPYVYAVARLMCGAGVPAFINVTCMAVIEFMPPKWRSFSNSIGPTGEGIMILSVLAYFIRPWRTLYWVTLAPFGLVVIIYPFIPESPRWLLRNGRVEEAEKVLKYIARINGSEPVSIEVINKLNENERIAAESLGPMRFSYLDFFRDKHLRTVSLGMMSSWFAWSLTFYGISYNIKNVKGNVYLNFFLVGLANALGQRAAMLINNRLGRRKSLFVSMSLSATFLVSLAFCEIFVTKDDILSILVVTFCLLSQFGMGSARSACRLLTGESFPTAVRTMGLGLGGVAANCAGIITPALTYMGSIWPSVPFFVFAIVSLMGSLVSFRMAETQGQPLSN